MKSNYSCENEEEETLKLSDFSNSSSPDNMVVKLSKRKLRYQQNLLTGKLTIGQKLCFAMGGLPYQMTGNCLGLFLPTFILEIAGLRPKDLSIILSCSKVWDAFTDPLIGYVVSKTDTKYGKLRPWILFFAPFAVFCYMMIWYVPFLDKLHKLYWYVLFYCAFQTFLSCLHVPYTSLTMYLTHNQRERDSATAFRMGMEVFGVFLAAMIQGVMISIYHVRFPCPEETNFMSNVSHLASMNQTLFNSTLENIEPPYNKLGEGYLFSAGIMGFIYLFCCVTTFFGTSEMEDVITDKNNHFVRSLGAVFRNKSYITLLLAFLFNSLSGQMLQTNFALYCKHAINGKDQYQLIIIVLLVTTILSVPFWQFLMFKLGKKLTYGLGLIMFIPNLIPLLFITNEVWLMYLCAAICGISMSSHFLLPWSMLPDVIDEFMIETGDRKEAIFYSFYVFFTKFSSGISVAGSSLLLEYSGYKDCPNGCCVQPESIKSALRFLVVPIPIILIVISIGFLWHHPIDDKKRKQIREKLDNIREKNRETLTNSKSNENL